ncbi:hypothetical protein [Haloarchaeobius sp. HRN-SO-5]|uniref:hypothetical protein n=1 Tax=Haloarchaeobius sp. HRN-SO-5 TaxID=3446118 RepID=UPI003EBF26F7
MSSIDLKLGGSVGCYVGLLAAIGYAHVLGQGIIGPVAKGVGVVTFLAVGGAFALRPALSVPIARSRLHHLYVVVHLLVVLVLVFGVGPDTLASESPLAFPFIVAASVGIVSYLFLRDRHNRIVFGDRPARVRWSGRASARTVRRKRILAVVAFVVVVPLAGVASLALPHVVPWFGTHPVGVSIAEAAPHLIGGMLGASIGTFLSPTQRKECAVYDDGLLLRGEQLGLRSLVPWWQLRGYRLTDDELVLYSRVPLQTYRFDLRNFEFPDRTAGILSEYVEEVESSLLWTWL